MYKKNTEILETKFEKYNIYIINIKHLFIDNYNIFVTL